ncbi:MAG TPA: CBS domain-containing protein [Gaiellaceae bacterium]|nr:CBS domain-containing protein [Gaiellaceae bacterium]
MSVSDAMAARLTTSEPGERVQTAIARMLEDEVASVAVVEEGRLVGIFTERDVLRLAGDGSPFGNLPLREVMTTELVTVAPDDDLVAAARLMQERRIRHLPVIQDGKVLGILGIREVLRTLVERLWSERDQDARETARDLLSRR